MSCPRAGWAPPCPVRPAEALGIPGTHHMAPDLFFYPVLNEREALAGVSDREVVLSMPVSARDLGQLAEKPSGAFSDDRIRRGDTLQPGARFGVSPHDPAFLDGQLAAFTVVSVELVRGAEGAVTLVMSAIIAALREG
jgi:hypothetical protein